MPSEARIAKALEIVMLIVAGLLATFIIYSPRFFS